MGSVMKFKISIVVITTTIFIPVSIPAKAQVTCFGVHCDEVNSTTDLYSSNFYNSTLAYGDLLSSFAMMKMSSNGNFGEDEQKCITSCKEELYDANNDCRILYDYPATTDLPVASTAYQMAKKNCFTGAQERYNRCLGAPTFDRCRQD